MDPTTLVLERLAADWATFMATFACLAGWGAVGLLLLLGAIFLVAAFVSPSEVRPLGR